MKNFSCNTSRSVHLTFFKKITYIWLIILVSDTMYAFVLLNYEFVNVLLIYVEKCGFALFCPSLVYMGQTFWFCTYYIVYVLENDEVGRNCVEIYWKLWIFLMLTKPHIHGSELWSWTYCVLRLLKLGSCAQVLTICWKVFIYVSLTNPPIYGSILCFWTQSFFFVLSN